MILTEFDYEKNAIINPWHTSDMVQGMPKVAVTCFSRVTFARMLSAFGGEIIASTNVANMEIPVYKTVYHGYEICLFMSDVGAPACVGAMEEIYAMGVETIIMFGTCGVLDKSIEDCSIIIPNAAIRDEGTSYHYMPAEDEIEVNQKYIPEFVSILEEFNTHYTIGKTWTTDAFYRETPKKMAKRIESGCISVEMECAAATAVAKFREKEFFEFFYAADNLAAEQWDKRSLSNEARVEEKDRVAILALELATKIIKSEKEKYISLRNFCYQIALTNCFLGDMLRKKQRRFYGVYSV